MGRLFYLMGKSASGKDHIYEKLIGMEKLRLKRFVLYTTRPMRDGEAEGREYHFTDPEGLRRMEEAGRIIEKREYHTVHGPWIYFTADNGEMDEEGSRWLGIGTPQSYCVLRNHFGSDKVFPLYIDVDDGIRLERALQRERQREKPDYAEMCRRYLSDHEDFSDENLRKAGITMKFSNDGELDACVSRIASWIREVDESGVQVR